MNQPPIELTRWVSAEILELIFWLVWSWVASKFESWLFSELIEDSTEPSWPALFWACDLTSCSAVATSPCTFLFAEAASPSTWLPSRFSLLPAWASCWATPRFSEAIAALSAFCVFSFSLFASLAMTIPAIPVPNLGRAVQLRRLPNPSPRLWRNW